ncbi:sigma-70 family RNA polymerase sigma factor [Planctomicrobium sp. SH527]|uniref:sigma-70 family RNA polymerase sigma factor n=1 Tax=Planctomicrobium sp. SH527 TaxID=3448123 RepID=UPI003F5B940A
MFHARNDQRSADVQYEEFLRHFSRDRERIFRYIYSLLSNYSDAEDVFQKCSLLLWHKFSEYDRDRSFLPWACGVALNEVRNFLRLSERKRMRFDSALLAQISDERLEVMESQESTAEGLAVLKDCVDSLPRRDRELVRIAYGGDLTVKDFAESLGQPLQTLYNRLGKVRRILLDCVRRKLREASI